MPDRTRSADVADARAASTTSRRSKPTKPYPEFPLFPHATGRWAKKIRGKFVFFGPWDDPFGALDRYLAQRDELMAGRDPRRGETNARTQHREPVRRGESALVLATAAPAAGPGTALGVRGETNAPTAGGRSKRSAVIVPSAGVTVRDLANHFLTAKRRRVDAGEMTLRSFSDYHDTAKWLVDLFGRNRPVEGEHGLGPEDFARLRAAIARKRGPVALANQIGRVRSVFKHGFEAGLLERPARFGPEFVKPAKRTMRLARRRGGEKMFEPEEIAALLAGAGVQMRAMVLLGLNAALGNTDVAGLAWSSVDLKAGVVDAPRSKTGIARRCVLWPETVAALGAVRKAVKRTRSVGDLVFVTKYGKPWVRVEARASEGSAGRPGVVKDAVASEFSKLTRETGTHRPGRGFYALRHTFRTVADEVPDRAAIDLIMGHEDGSDIAVHYVERISDERLRRVVEHVRVWALRC